MVKKLLFILIVLSVLTVFSQEKSVNKLVASPNPFYNSTIITFNSTTQQEVLVSVRNVLGKTVFMQKILAHKGENELTFKKNDLVSGMYIYAIQTGREVISKRFVIR